MKGFVLSLAVCAAAWGLASCADIENDPDTLPQNIVDRAADTLMRFRGDDDLSKFMKYAEGARAVVILPTVVKAGLIGAAEAGNGVLMVRAVGGGWSAPVFYTLISASIGIQGGIQDTEIVLIVRTAKALEAILEHQGKLGADVGITVGVSGAGAEAATTTNMGADVLAFANAVLGVYGGASLEGSVLARRNDLNEAYYGAGATPQSIVSGESPANAGADSLRAAIERQ